MAFSHILITRPRDEGAELAELLSEQAAEAVPLPAYEFRAMVPFTDLLALLKEAGAGSGDARTDGPGSDDAGASDPGPLVVFTSPRAVEHGLPRIPEGVLANCRVAAIGPTTARLLDEAGVEVTLEAGQGYTSEDLLEEIPECQGSAPEGAREAFILTAPGGRSALAEGLKRKGYRPHLLLVYERKPAELDADAVAKLTEAETVLSVWTSADSIRSLSQRLPAECWKRLCAGEWIVISERLARVARSFHPACVHIARGPTNEDLAAAIKSLD